MSFEVFVTRFTNDINDKERDGRTMSDIDIFYAIWYKVQLYRIYHYKSALQVQHSLNPCVWKNILNTIITQVSKLSVSKNIRNVYEVSLSNRYTHDGDFPDSRVRNFNGCAFIGSYPNNKWHSDSVKPYWEEIINARVNDGNHVSRKKKTMRNKIKRERHKLNKIKS